MRGITVHIYRPDRLHTVDTTNGGVTAVMTAGRTFVVFVPGCDLREGPTLDEVRAAPERFVALRVTRRATPSGGDYLEPFDRPTDPYTGPMFGGHFAWSSSSTFSRFVAPGPLAVHDRFEAYPGGGSVR